MKIGITCYPTYGGSGAVATELGIALAERGHEVHFITYRQPFRLPSFLPKDEATQLLDVAPGAGAAGQRDRALVELLYASGLRVAECCGLGVDDLDEARRTVRVLGKGGKITRQCVREECGYRQEVAPTVA